MTCKRPGLTSHTRKALRVIAADLEQAAGATGRDQQARLREASRQALHAGLVQLAKDLRQHARGGKA